MYYEKVLLLGVALILLFSCDSVQETIGKGEKGLKNDENSALTIEVLDAKYNLKSVPITLNRSKEEYLQFESLEELDEWLNQVENLKNELVIDLDDIEGDNLEVSIPVETPSLKRISWPSYRVNVSCRLSYYDVYEYQGSTLVKDKVYTGASNYNSWITGWTAGLSWDHKSGSYRISNDRRRITITARGVLEYYIFVEGIGRVYSKNDRASVTAN